MPFGLTWAALGFALLIFILRVINYSISTMRLVFIGRDYRIPAAGIAFFEALIFAVVMSQVLKDVTYIPNLLAYCLGASVGSYLGQWLESRLIVSYSTVTIIAKEKGRDIADALREANYGVTLTKGEGRDGEVDILRSTSVNRDLSVLKSIVNDIHPQAFVEIEAARSLSRGWIPGGPPRRQRNS